MMRKTRVFSILLCAVILFAASCVSGVAWAQTPGATDAAKQGAKILSDAASAAGGDALKSVKSLEVTSTGNLTSPNGPLSATVKIQIVYPDKLRVDTDLGMAMISSGYDGKAGWFFSPQGAMDIPEDMNNEVLRGIDLTGPLGLYKKSLSGKAEATLVGEKEWEGKKAWLVEWNGPSGKVKLYFDQATKLPVAAQYRALTLQGSVDEERRWSDYRDVEGVKFPYHWVTNRDGSVYSDLTVTGVKINATVDAGAFAKPQ